MKRYSQAELETLGAQYGKMDTDELAALFGVTPDNLRKQASRMGLSQPWPEFVEPYRQGDDYVIPLCSRKHPGKVAYVDADQYHLVEGHRWHVVRTKGGVYYARTNIDCRPRDMHKFLLEVSRGMTVDHIDGDGLNNRSSNLRPATPQQNGQNKHKRNGERNKGVVRLGRRFQSRIAGDILGMFETEVDAALAYDRAALERWGEFASLNYPHRQENPDNMPETTANRT